MSTAPLPAPAKEVALNFRPRRIGWPQIVEVYDRQRGELLEKDTLVAVAHWLEDRGYRWIVGSDGVWTAPA